MNAVAKVQDVPAAMATVADRIALETLLDRLSKDDAALNRAWMKIGPEDSPPTTEGIAEFEQTLSLWRANGLHSVARAQALLTLCDNPNYIDDNGNPRRSEISKVLAALLGSFPTANVPDPKVFTWALLEDVAAQVPCWHELESTCRVIRRTKTFVPAIAEVLKILADETAKWDRRLAAFDDLGFFATGECVASLTALKTMASS